MVTTSDSLSNFRPRKSTSLQHVRQQDMTESFFDRIMKTGIVDFFRMILSFIILPILRMGPGK